MTPADRATACELAVFLCGPIGFALGVAFAMTYLAGSGWALLWWTLALTSVAWGPFIVRAYRAALLATFRDRGRRQLEEATDEEVAVLRGIFALPEVEAEEDGGVVH